MVSLMRHKRSLTLCRTSLEIKKSFYPAYPTRRQADPAHPVNLSFDLLSRTKFEFFFQSQYTRLIR
ncbi:MAG: hypothetical protein S4CHLAM123_02730 [Chlamydiales bacterium]|nr:hypothetical protein [Chlamydiales bacterium]